MEYKNLTASEKIPVLGLGTWRMGGNGGPDYSQDKKYIGAIEYAIERGLTHLDTAEIYSGGHAEELISQAIKEIARKKLFITSKVWPTHLSYDNILKAYAASLSRLGTDYLDLYLIHWPNPLASMKNAMAAFDKLVDDGLVRHIGVSNFSVRQFKNAQDHAKHKLVCNQVKFSLRDRGPERELLPFCARENVILTAYSPLAQGDLARGEKGALSTVAKKYGKTPVQVALRWLIEKPQVVTIPKASTASHIDEIVGALGWHLKEEDQQYLKEEFA